jgi:low affinity Fe/Cu permease
VEVATLDKIDERLARMEELLHQLIGLVGKTNSGLVDLESRLNQRIDGLEQRLDRSNEGHHREVTILKSESDHLASKVGVLERDLAVLRRQP